jgi:hypothetical protein
MLVEVANARRKIASVEQELETIEFDRDARLKGLRFGMRSPMRDFVVRSTADEEATFECRKRRQKADRRFTLWRHVMFNFFTQHLQIAAIGDGMIEVR